MKGPISGAASPFCSQNLPWTTWNALDCGLFGGGWGKTLHGGIPCMMLHHSLVVLPLRHYLCVLVFRGSRSGKEGMSWVRDRVWVGLGSWRLGEDAQVWRGERGGEWAGEGDQCWIDTHDAKHDGDDAGEGERCYSRRSGGKRLARVAVLLKCIGGLLARVLDEYPNGISTQLIRNLVWIVVVNAHRVDTVRCWSPYPRARVRGALCARAHSVAHSGAVAGARRQRTRPSTRLQGARNGRPPVPRDIASSLVLPVHTVAHALALARQRQLQECPPCDLHCCLKMGPAVLVRTHKGLVKVRTARKAALFARRGVEQACRPARRTAPSRLECPLLAGLRPAGAQRKRGRAKGGSHQPARLR